MFFKLFKNKKNTIITLVLIGIIVICAYLIYKKQNPSEEVFNNISLNKIENFDGIGKVYGWHSNPHPGPCHAGCSCFPGSYVRNGNFGNCKQCNRN